jgi:hypothetical protein
MENHPENKRARTEDSCHLLSSWQRKKIFDSFYNFNPSFDVDHELFNINSEELVLKYPQFDEYFSILEEKELEFKAKKIAKKKQHLALDAEILALEAKESELKNVRLETKFKTAKTNFFIKTGVYGNDDNTFKALIDRISNSIGVRLIDLIEDRLNAEDKIVVTRTIIQIAGKGSKVCDDLLLALDLNNVDVRKCIIPLKTQGSAHSPSTMSGLIQKLAAINNKNHIFAFPYDIKKHFPVLFCHPVFADFVDILDGRIDLNHYNDIIDRKNLDKCVSDLIEVMLYSGENQKEAVFVTEVTLALKKLFPCNAVRSEVTINLDNSSTTGYAPNLNLPRMDAVVFINSFPFILLEAKNNTYSINAVLQGLQYYGLTVGGYIDNDPCFLITLDRGIFFIYGVAMVNRRVVCTCLLSLEFTSHLFNIDGFVDKLCKCFGALYYFYTRFSSRIPEKSQDGQHLKYSNIKSKPTFEDEPYPAIFSVAAKGNPSNRIMITFESIVKTIGDKVVEEAAFFKPCVYLVKTGNNEKAVLKLTNNYDIETHEKMASIGLAPNIIGHETLCEQYQIILMEYFDNSYDSLFNYLYNSESNHLDRFNIYNSLRGIITKIQEFNIVHGDFRSCNILAKRSLNNPSILEDFKLIDFELSGNVGTPYPALALINHSITWPTDFCSFMPRKFDHDLFMLEMIKNNELKIEI